jgi:acyl-CoA synthetase (AMP-forming)/AMP-acid ligase II
VSLADCLDLGAALVPTAPCLVSDGGTALSYAEVQGLSRSIGSSLHAYGVGPHDTVGVLSANDPLALTCVFGASRAGVAWALVDPTEARFAGLADRLTACDVLLFRAADAGLVRSLQPLLPRLRTLVCLDGEADGATGWGRFLTAGLTRAAFPALEQQPGARAEGPTLPEDPDGKGQTIFLALRLLSPETAGRWQPVLAQGGRVVMRARERAEALSALQA